MCLELKQNQSWPLPQCVVRKKKWRITPLFILFMAAASPMEAEEWGCTADIVQTSPGATKLSLNMFLLTHTLSVCCFCSVFLLFFAITLFKAALHTQKIFNQSLKQPDDVSLLQGEKSEVFSQYTAGAGNVCE